MARMSRFRKWLSGMLSATLLLTTSPILPAPAHAQAPAASANPEAVKPGTSPRELTNHRTTRSKRFLNPDGSLTEKIYMEPIHYRDASGTWQGIDNDLVLNSKGNYKNKANRFGVELNPTANGGFFTFSQEGASFSFRPLFAKPIRGSLKKSRIEYKEATPGTDLSYQVIPTGLKETLLLKNAKVPTSFTYEFKVANLSYAQQPDGSVAFSKPGSKEVLFNLMPPTVVDADRTTKKNLAAYHIHQDEKGTMLLDLVLDADWVQAANRAFPVTVDPTIKVQNKPLVDDTVLSSALPDDDLYASYSHVYVGQSQRLGTTRSLLRFNLSSLPSSAVISSSYLNVTNTRIDLPSQSPVVEAHRITADWNSCDPSVYTNCATFTNQPAVGGVDGTYTASNTTAPFTWAVPITSLARDWYNGVQANYGVELKYANESLVTRELLATDDSSDPAYHPYLTVNYSVDGLGSQPFWTYDGPVNVVNRNLVLPTTDIAFPGRGVTVSLKRTYNSRSTNTGVFGYGWSSPLDMRLYTPTRGPARLVDGDGTTHYFAEDVDGNYLSPPGLFWTLDASGTNPVVQTSDGMKYTFSGGKLITISDVGGNTLTYTWSGSTVTNIADSAGHKITLTYSGSNVKTATDPAQRVWTYGYSNGNLVSVTRPDNSTYSYRYDSAHNLMAVVSSTGKGTYYSYELDDRLFGFNPGNAVTNANFEVDSDGDGLADHFRYNNGQASLNLDTSGSPYGQSVRLDESSSNSYNYTVVESDPIYVDPTKPYILSASVKATQSSGTLTTILAAYAYDASDTYLGEAGRKPLTGTFDWQRVTTSIDANTLPAGTVSVRFKIASSAVGGSGSSWFDAVQLEQGTAASEFLAGNQYTNSATNFMSARYDGDGNKMLYTYNDNQNVTQMQQDPANLKLTDTFTWDPTLLNTLTAHSDPRKKTWSFKYDPDKGNLVNVTDPKSQSRSFSWDQQSNLTQFTGTKSDTYSMTYDNGQNNTTQRDPYATSQAFDYDAYRNTTKETRLLGWADNLIDNTSFETVDATTLVPAHFAFNSGQNGNWVVSTDAVYGKKSFLIYANSANANQYSILKSDPVTVEKGTDYVLSGYLKSTQYSGDGHLTVLSVIAYDSTGAEIQELGRIAPTGTIGGWQRWSTQIFQGEVPTNAVTFRVKIAASNSNGSGASQFDAIQLQKNPVDTTYNLVDNSSFEQGTSFANDWLKAPLGTTTWTTNSTPSNVYAGAHSVTLSGASDWSGVGYADYTPYNANKTYNLTAYVKTNALSSNVAHIKIEEYDASKKLLANGQVSSRLLSGTNDWQRLSVELGAQQAVAGTAFIRPVLMTGNATGSVTFDNIRLQVGKVTTAYGYDSTSTWMTTRTEPWEDPNDPTIAAKPHQYQMDTAGNVWDQVSPKGWETQFFYDANDRLIGTAPQGNDLKVNYDIDADDNLYAIRNTNRLETTTYNTYKMLYNAVGKLSSMTDPLNRQTTYSYTPGSRLQRVQTPEGSTSFAYDKAGRMTTLSLNDTTAYTFTNDENNNTQAVTDTVNKRTWSATYDDLNRMTSWSNGSYAVNYNLDETGNVQDRTLTQGTTQVKKETTYFDKLSHPRTHTDPDGKISRFLFNENSQLSVLQSGNGVSQRFSYDTIGKVRDVRNQLASGKMLSSFSYLYDQDGNTSSVTDMFGNALSFTYTGKEQMYSEELPNSNVVTYAYDPLGNMQTRTETKADGTPVKTTTYGYDIANQLTSLSGVSKYTYDGNGNLTSNGTYKFKWDAAGRLTEVDDTADKPLATYQYDNRGRRVYQKVGADITTFLYDGASTRVLAEFDGTGALTKYYTWSPLGQLLSLTANGNKYYTVRNAHGDIVQLTDETGTEVASYTYDAWGNILNQTGDAAVNPYRYANYRYDDLTGFYYLVGRYYDPSISRFISPDPESMTQDYSYGSNNPMSYVDNNGHWLLDLIFVVADTAEMIANPTWEGAAWLALDVVSTAIPVGSISAVAHAARAVEHAAHAIDAVREVGEVDRIAGKAYHATEEISHHASGIGSHAGDGLATAAKGKGELGYVYLRTSSKGGTYVGQAKSKARFVKRQAEHRRAGKKKGVTYDFVEIGRAKAGRDLDILEQKKILEHGGIQREGGILENGRHQIARKYWSKYGIEE